MLNTGDLIMDLDTFGFNNPQFICPAIRILGTGQIHIWVDPSPTFNPDQFILTKKKPFNYVYQGTSVVNLLRTEKHTPSSTLVLN